MKTGGRRMHACPSGSCALRRWRARRLHGGICVFFWKEAWLKRDGDTTVDLAGPATVTLANLPLTAYAAGEQAAADPVYVCQTTALFDATTLLPWWDVRQYVRD